MATSNDDEDWLDNYLKDKMKDPTFAFEYGRATERGDIARWLYGLAANEEAGKKEYLTQIAYDVLGAAYLKQV